MERINKMRPDTITFTETGLDCDGPSGASSMVPWQHFTSWREGKRVLLLKFGGAKRYAIFIAIFAGEGQAASERDMRSDNCEEGVSRR